MAYSVQILPTAEREVEDIVGYLLSHGTNTARRFTDKYRAQLKLLASGTVDFGLAFLPELADLGYRTCLVNTFVLLYYYEGNNVVIAHVFHQSQDYASLVLPHDAGSSSLPG